MNKKRILKAFGECYNRNDFMGISSLLDDNTVYDAYDCIYKVTSQKDVLDVLRKSIKADTGAFEGYYIYKGILFSRLSECVLICDENTLKCIRIINIKTRRGKISYITGFNPKEYEFTRGKKIAD